MMIDALEVRIPSEVRLREEWQGLRSNTYPLARRHHYSNFVDLRSYGMPLHFHASCRRSKREHDKVTFVQTSSLTFHDICATLSKLTECDPGLFAIMRIDFAVDVCLTVEWFRRFAFVPRKRRYREISSRDGACIETLYFGSRPNFLRIYDKRAQMKAKKNFSSLTSLETPLTRVERQCSGPQVPSTVAKVSYLPNAVSHNPFAQLHFGPYQELYPVSPSGAVDFLTLAGWMALVNDLGRQGAAMKLRTLARGNSARVLRRIDNALSPLPAQKPDLLELFRASISKQLEGR
jgi:hypothetical protein